MAGAIFLSRTRGWSASSWAYRQVVDFLIEHVGDPGAVDQLRFIEDMNFGAVNFDEFTDDIQMRMLDLLASQLLPTFEAEFSGAEEYRTGIKKVMTDLASMAKEEVGERSK
jgi:hypothetical protein